MSTEYNYDVAIAERELLVYFLGQILTSRRGVLRGNRAFLNADFNMLFTYIWRSTPRDIPEYKDYGKNLVELLAAHPKDTSEFSVYFTLPSFLELLDSFHHHAKNAERLLNQAKSYKHYQKSEFNKIIFDESSMSSGDAEKELSRIMSITSASDVKFCLKRAIDLIGRDGRINGIDDLIHEDIHYNKRDVTLFNDILKKMDTNRSRNDDRPIEDRHFHYKVDAANIITTQKVSNLNGIDSRFVTHQTMIDRYCRDNGINAQMPFLWLSSHLLCKHSQDDYGGDIDHFLKTMQKLIKESLSILKEYNGKPIPKNYLHIIDLLHKDYLEPIHRRTLSKPQSPGQSTGQENTEYDLSYESYVKFKARAEETRDVLGDSVRTLVSSTPYILDSDTIRVFDFNSDEMVKQIRANFKV